jgi:hypothetical protein
MNIKGQHTPFIEAAKSNMSIKGQHIPFIEAAKSFGT